MSRSRAIECWRQEPSERVGNAFHVTNHVTNHVTAGLGSAPSARFLSACPGVWLLLFKCFNLHIYSSRSAHALGGSFDGEQRNLCKYQLR